MSHTVWYSTFALVNHWLLQTVTAGVHRQHIFRRWMLLPKLAVFNATTLSVTMEKFCKLIMSCTKLIFFKVY